MQLAKPRNPNPSTPRNPTVWMGLQTRGPGSFIAHPTVAHAINFQWRSEVCLSQPLDALQPRMPSDWHQISRQGPATWRRSCDARAFLEISSLKFRGEIFPPCASFFAIFFYAASPPRHEPWRCLNPVLRSVQSEKMPDLISVHPAELTFRFELRKQSSCTLRLTNSANDVVAFKVKTTAPKKYCVRPNCGLIQPRSSCDVTVTMQAQKEVPDNQCKDKFLIQSTVAPKGVALSSIQPEMFTKEANKSASETKVRVVYLPVGTSSEKHEPGESARERVLRSRSPQQSESRSRISMSLLLVILICAIAISLGYYIGQSSG